MRRWLTNLRAVLPDRVLDRAAILVEHGRIAALIEGDPPAVDGSRQIDGRGMLALPGLVDLYTDLLERELEPRPTATFPIDAALHELDKRLAGAGITSAWAALRYEPGSHWLSRSGDRVRAIAARALVERDELLTGIQLQLSCDLRDPAASLLAERLLADDDGMALALQAPGASAGLAQRPGLVALAPADAAAVTAAAASGARICLLPATREAAEAARGRGMAVAIAASSVVRREPAALGMLADGLAQALVSDESPIMLLQAALALADSGMSLQGAVALVASAPADAIGLPSSGRLQVGARADLILVAVAPRPHVFMTLRDGWTVYGRA